MTLLTFTVRCKASFGAKNDPVQVKLECKEVLYLMYLLPMCRHYGHKSRRKWCRAPKTTASL